eukprot:scpid54121/ scgid20710/ E3 ubiquitin-protein ligase LRSAM1; Leucine-rich repeat and sterile alpha motif-containing protein 1; Tsg101-associated ligase
MSFLFRKQGKEGKKKTEQQLYAGKDGPGNAFDLSNCDLYEVPPGLFAQCKYLRKEVLILHTNHLRSLKASSSFGAMEALQVLDVSNNELRSLPDDLGSMKNLRELNVSLNKLQELPSSVGGLTSLVKLEAQSNSLQGVPGALGQCKQLAYLDVSDNYDIVGLPRDLAHAQALEVIKVRHERFGFPPKSIMTEGVPAIMKFLCDTCSIPYSPTKSVGERSTGSEHSASPSSLYPTLDLGDSASSDAFKRHTDDKERRRSENIALEQQNTLAAQEQQALMSSSSSRKMELLKQLAEEQAKHDADLATLQQRRESDQQKLIQTVQQEEKTYNEAVAQKMREADRAREEDIRKALDHDKMMLEQLSSMRQESEQLRRGEVLDAMQRLLSKSRHHELLCIAQITERQRLAKQALKESNAIADAQVSLVLEQQSEFQKNLLNQIASEDLAQRLAFEALLLDKDDQHTKATQQIVALQQELAQLTNMEISRKAKEQNTNQARLEEQRNVLTAQLRLLMDVQQERAEQLQLLLVKFEEERKSEEKDYWLRMYQRLMDSKPEALLLEELSLEESVVHMLRTANATQFLTAFARNHISFELLVKMDDDDLRRLGVTSIGARHEILKCVAEEAAIESRAKEKSMVLLKELEEMEPHEKPEPSAPIPGLPIVPSAPSISIDDSEPAPAPSQPYASDLVGLPLSAGATAPQPAHVYPSAPLAEAEAGSGGPAVQLSECVVCLDNQ